MRESVAPSRKTRNYAKMVLLVERGQQLTAEQIGDVPQLRDETVDEVMLVPSECEQQFTAEQIGDVLQYPERDRRHLEVGLTGNECNSGPPKKIEVMPQSPSLQSKLLFRSGFLKGARLSKCPRSHAKDVWRLSKLPCTPERLSARRTWSSLSMSLSR